MLAAALALVLGGVRAYGWLSLQRAERQLAAALGSEADARPPAVGGPDTTSPGLVAALGKLDAREEQVASLAELAMLGSGPMSQEQQKRAETAVEAHAAALTALASLPDLPPARLGLWGGIEPEEEGKLQAGLLMLAQLAAVDGRLGCEARDRPRFERAVAVLSRIATSLELEALTQPLLVGLMVENTQHLLLARGIVAGMCDADADRRLEGAIVTLDLRLAYRRSLRAQVAQLEALRSSPGLNLASVRSWLADLVYFDLHLARALDELATEAGEVDRPFLASLAAAGRMQGLGAVGVAATLGTAGRVQVVAAGRGMARASLVLRRTAVERGAYPQELAQVPEALDALAAVGVGVVLEHGADGSARLRVPGGDEGLRVLSQDATHPSLLTWELPAVVASPARR